MNTIIHPIPPFLQKDSSILILGSFPSIKSRETGFYYGNPQNRFWKLLAHLYETEIPDTNEKKKYFLSQHRIALWDVVACCTIHGSSDSSIRNVQVNNVAKLVLNTEIRAVFLNGQLAGRLYESNKAIMPMLPSANLPSTSAANASKKLEHLTDAWRIILDYKE